MKTIETLTSFDELIAPVKWSGIQSEQLAALQPFERQGGLVTTWEAALPPHLARRKAHLASALTLMLLKGTTFENDPPDGFRLHMDKWAVMELPSTAAFVRWAGKEVACRAFAGQREGLSHWAMVGSNEAIALGAFATEVSVQTPRPYQPIEEVVTSVVVSVGPLQPQFAELLAK